MAAFSTLALIGLSAAAGLFAGKKMAPKPTNPYDTLAAAAPAPETKPVTPVTPQPPDAQKAASDAQKAATGVAQKQRRKAAAGLATTPALKGFQGSIVGQSTAKTLIGY